MFSNGQQWNGEQNFSKKCYFVEVPTSVRFQNIMPLWGTQHSFFLNIE